MVLPSIYGPATVAALLVVHYFLRRRARRLPPGPKGHFLLGNLSDLPQTDAGMAKTFVKWREDYGDIMHLDVFGNHMIVLNSVQATRDLMDKRAAMYSDRPRMVMIGELVGNDWVFSITSGELHKEQRSVAQRYFLAQIKDWQHVQLDTARTLVRNLYAKPSDWPGLIRLSTASSVLRICYGHDVTRPDDPLLKIVEDALDAPPEKPYMVNYFPILKYYPSWLPGGQFKRDAANAKVIHQRLRYMPFNMVRNQMAAGTASPSFISTLLSQLPPNEDLDRSHQAGLIRDAAAAMFAAAVDTTISLMYTFLAVMVLHPDVQRRAQSELDSVLDQDRLPTFDDRSSLPFVECIILEILRWNVVTPLGLPHTVTQDDEYLGYQIPKGSTVLGNVWAILRDPKVFPNAEQFDPSRFFPTTEGGAIARETIESTVFGWGRRVCPGRHVGHSTLFILISHILACFDISKPLNDAEDEVEPVLTFHVTTFVRQAQPMPCRISVRSERIAGLLSHPE